MRIDIWKPASDPSLQHHLGCGPRLPSEYWWVCRGRGMRNISRNTTKLCSRFAVGDFELNYSRTQTTDNTARVTVHLHSNSISDYNELNKWQVFILSKCRGHPRQCAFITFSSVKLFCSECLKNILIAIVYLSTVLVGVPVVLTSVLTNRCCGNSLVDMLHGV